MGFDFAASSFANGKANVRIEGVFLTVDATESPVNFDPRREFASPQIAPSDEAFSLHFYRQS